MLFTTVPSSQPLLASQLGRGGDIVKIIHQRLQLFNRGRCHELVRQSVSIMSAVSRASDTVG
eukprot:10686666-Karenia_brevis.AAC.1